MSLSKAIIFTLFILLIGRAKGLGSQVEQNEGNQHDKIEGSQHDNTGVSQHDKIEGSQPAGIQKSAIQEPAKDIDHQEAIQQVAESKLVGSAQTRHEMDQGQSQKDDKEEKPVMESSLHKSTEPVNDFVSKSVLLQSNSAKVQSVVVDEPKKEELAPAQDIGWIPQLEKEKFIAFGVHIILALSGVYTIFFGFRYFRLLMVILGFYVSYYGILLALTELKIYKSNDIGHQMGLFFGCIILGFIISILCYMLDKINFLIIGMAVASVIALFAAQFFIDFKVAEDRVLLLVIYLLATSVFSLMAFFFLDHFIIIAASVVGAVITPINIGVIFGDFKSFEDREKIPADRLKDLQVYLLVCGCMFITGLASQYYLRSRIVKRMGDSTLDEIRGTSFLN